MPRANVVYENPEAGLSILLRYAKTEMWGCEDRNAPCKSKKNKYYER